MSVDFRHIYDHRTEKGIMEKGYGIRRSGKDRLLKRNRLQERK